MRTAISIILVSFALFGEMLPEFLLPVHSAQDSYTPSVAYGEGVFLVCWQSGRIDEGDLRLGPRYRSSIVGCRVDTNGNVLDSEPFVVSSDDDLRESPMVVYAGTHFVVVWHDFRNGTDWDIYAARISRSGTILDPDGILVSGGAHNQAMPQAAYDGTNTNIAWIDARSNAKYEVYMARLSSEGVVLDPDGIIAATGVSHYTCPVIAPAADGKVFLFSVGTSSTFSEGYQYAVSPTVGNFFLNGSKITPAAYSLLHTDTPEQYPLGLTVPIAIASAGANGFLVAWQNETNTGGRGNSMVPSNGAIFNASGERVHELYLGLYKSDLYRIMRPSVSWDGNGFMLVWDESNPTVNKGPVYEKVCFAKIGISGDTVIPPTLVAGVSNAPATAASVASDTTIRTSLIVYEKQPSSGTVPITVGCRIFKSGVTLSESCVADNDNFVLSAIPNPFNPVVRILINRYSVDKIIELKVHDLQGRLVANLSSDVQKNGNKASLLWNASKVPSGLYIVSVKNGNASIRKTIQLIK